MILPTDCQTPEIVRCLALPMTLPKLPKMAQANSGTNLKPGKSLKQGN
jgi:hypothetical protein